MESHRMKVVRKDIAEKYILYCWSEHPLLAEGKVRCEAFGYSPLCFSGSSPRAYVIGYSHRALTTTPQASLLPSKHSSPSSHFLQHSQASARYSLTSSCSSQGLLTLHVSDLREKPLAPWSSKSPLEMRTAGEHIFDIFSKIPSGGLPTPHHGGLGILTLHYLCFTLRLGGTWTVEQNVTQALWFLLRLTRIRYTEMLGTKCA